MKGEWCYWKNYFSKEECADIINRAMKISAVSSTLGEESRLADPNIRKSSLRWLSEDNPDFQHLFKKFWELEVRMNRDFFGFNVQSLPSLQFTEYDSEYEGEYKSHQDIFWCSSKPTHRKISMIVQLSDPSEYEGGRLVLERTTHSLPNDCIEQGTVIAFPSFIYHRLEPVTKGKRYSLVGWFEGPKFQ
jgi:PKHD-type hydroxylase